MQQQECPACLGTCFLNIDMATGDYTHLPDRIMALSDLNCTVTCTDCGFARTGVVRDLDIEIIDQRGIIRFGEIHYDPI